jgi:hypothetical protein
MRSLPFGHCGWNLMTGSPEVETSSMQIVFDYRAFGQTRLGPHFLSEFSVAITIAVLWWPLCWCEGAYLCA